MLKKISSHDHKLPLQKASIRKWKVPAIVRKEVLRFLEECELGKVNRGFKISESRQAKYLNMLRVPLEFFHKPSGALKMADVERFEKALSTDQIISRQKRKPYAHATKVDIRKALKVYLRWRLGQAKAISLIGWLDTRDQEKTPDYLSEHEAEQLYRSCPLPEHRFMVALLFDAGARAEEFLNNRLEDIRLPEEPDNFAKLTLKEEYSKTKGRTISLYWRHSLEAIREYVQQRIQEGLKSEDPVFAKNYDAMRMFLRRLGKAALNKSVYPHLFRHSSATFYATRLNRQELCYRYGWKFSSNMPDIYISRAGMENKELDLKFTATELGSLKDDLSRLKQQNQIKDERIATFEKTIENLQRNMSMVTEILAQKPSLDELKMAIKRRKQIE